MSHVGKVRRDIEGTVSSDPGPAMSESVILTAGTGHIRIEGGRATVIAGSATLAEQGDTMRATAEVRPGGPEFAAPVAEPATKADIPRMVEPVSRDEMNARLEAVEARLDAKVAQVGADVQVVGAKMDALAAQMMEFRADVRREVGELRSEVKGTKWWIVGSALSVIGIMVGIGTYVLTASGNNMASLQTGVAIGQALTQSPPATKP